MKYTLIAHSNIQDLTGQGMEALADTKGRVIAMFLNGYFFSSATSCLSRKSALSRVGTPSLHGSDEPTLFLAEDEKVAA